MAKSGADAGPGKSQGHESPEKSLGQYGRSLKDAVTRKFGGRFKLNPKPTLQTRKSASPKISRPWNDFLRQKLKAGLDILEARRLANEFFGYPPAWSPGYGDPAEFSQ